MLITFSISAQTVKDFFYAEKENKELPVYVRGNLKNNTILLYVAGSYGDNAIDFARSDYPGWKNTLEKECAIAYYDKRGLNKRLNKIDEELITWDQFGQDILSIVTTLRKRYQSDIYVMGHSAGGMLVYHYLSMFNQLESNPIEGAIILNTPFTSDSSPSRYTIYRPQYLKNVAKEYVENGIDTTYWSIAHKWMVKTDSIHSRETSVKWNEYVDNAFVPKKRKISIGMTMKVLFAKPYGLKYLNNKDNDLVGDLLWNERQEFSDEQYATMLSKINHPVLLITGRFDSIAVPEELDLFKLAIEQAETMVIPDCGHESYLDQPDRLNKAILSFLSD